VDDSENRKIRLLEQIVDNTFDTNVLLGKILAALTKQTDIVNLGGSISKPINQQGEQAMAVKSLGPTELAQNMFDDQKATYTPAPTNAQGVAEAFPTGTAPVYTASPGTAVKLTPATDGSGSLLVTGVPTVAGVEVITGVYTNSDGTTATVTLTFTQSVDPAEADIAVLGGSISTPVAQ
jgi:hypothetical protein